MNRKQVLFISQMFPPVGGPGVQRSAKFVKYLPQFGWEPVVLTSTYPTLRPRDETLLHDLPPETTIIRIRTFQPLPGQKSLLSYCPVLFSLLIPDLGTLWIPCAWRAALREMSKRPIKAIYATGAPFSSHVLGALLKKISRLPLVLDYRDEWTLDPLHQHWHGNRRGWSYSLERRQHRWAVRQANRVLLVSDIARQAFVKHFGPPDKFVTVRNGFDPADFGSAVEPELEKGKFHVVYCGSTIPPTTKPDVLFSGLQRALGESASLRKNLRIHFVGEMDTDSRELITRLGLENTVRSVGYVSHPESVGYLRRADLLLLIATSFTSRVTGKIYEYIGARKPVLVLACQDGESVALLRQAGVGIWADPEDPSDIAAKVIELERSWAQGTLQIQGSNEDFIQSVTRESSTRRLAEILDGVISLTG